jgi:ketosteroid isomerase-like protein
MAREEENLALVRAALEAIASGATGERLAAFFHTDFLQEEYPNRMSPLGARRDLESTLVGAERGQQLMRSQRWEVLSAIAHGDTVAVELDWSGVLAVDAGPLPAGHQLRAQVAIFIEVRDGRIFRQRNYDCYLP